MTDNSMDMIPFYIEQIKDLREQRDDAVRAKCELLSEISYLKTEQKHLFHQQRQLHGTLEAILEKLKCNPTLRQEIVEIIGANMNWRINHE